MRRLEIKRHYRYEMAIRVERACDRPYLPRVQTLSAVYNRVWQRVGAMIGDRSRTR